MLPSFVRRKIQVWWKRGSLLLIFMYSLVVIYNWTTREYGNPWDINYFIGEDYSGKMEYIVDTPKCKILKMSPWEEAILKFIVPKISPPDCKAVRHWTFQQDNKIHMNTTAILESGYSTASIRCCYRGILRVQQTIDSYDANADEQVKYTEDCIPMELVTEVKYQFVRVFCTSSAWPYLGEIVYRDYYAVPTVATAGVKAKRKIDHWKEKTLIPPSVLMLGIDSLSRMNFHRSFNRTKALLSDIGAVEFLGYTKIGENTLPNAAAFLSGHTPDQLSDMCMRTPDSPQDSCPYAWKLFHKANYLTATVEDAPGLVAFNYLKTGFVEEPTDFYFRPFMLAVHKSLPRKDYYHTDCIGHLTTEETLLNYIKGVMALSSRSPVFVHSWMTSLAHLDINGARFADSTVVEFLSQIDLSNTILIFLSDHGQRYGAIRETLAGWYEDKLPFNFMYLPPSITTRHPEWKTSLEENAKKLTSPYDLYQTMMHILKEYSSLSDQPRSYGNSLFTPISSHRSCSDAGIKVNYCACLPPRKVDASDQRMTLSAEAAVNYLNDILPSQCARTKLDRVVAGAIMATEDKGEEGTYLVTFYTNPGQFLFEATVEFKMTTDELKFNVTKELLRMNKIDRPANCVQTAALERYCYCT